MAVKVREGSCIWVILVLCAIILLIITIIGFVITLGFAKWMWFTLSLSIILSIISIIAYAAWGEGDCKILNKRKRPYHHMI